MFASWIVGMGLLVVPNNAIVREPKSTAQNVHVKQKYSNFGNDTISTESQENDDFNYMGSWFEQRLDHFTTTDLSTWKQRYWVMKDQYTQGGPVFLQVGAEWAMSGAGMFDNSAWQVYAERHHAMRFQLEHRFYGESHPTSDMSDATLKYLTTQQAVADIAQFIEAMNLRYKLPQDTKWVVFGCSCSATLAAWARYKYPHLVYGAVASSAPVWIKLDFPEYLNVARESLRTFGDNCVTAIQEAFQELDHLLVSPNASFVIQDKLRLCDPFDVQSRNDVTNLYERLANEVMLIVQTNWFSEYYLDWKINNVCNRVVGITSNKTSVLERFVEAMTKHGDYPRRCLDPSYNHRIERLRDSKWSTQTDRQYIYQMCSEIGYFQTAEDDSSFLGSRMPMEFYHQLCADAYGVQFTKASMEEAVAHANMLYGGLNITATRVIYVHGSFDPWQALGITQTSIPESPAIFIHGASHCSDSYEAHINDPIALTEARNVISDIIGTWIEE